MGGGGGQVVKRDKTPKGSHPGIRGLTHVCDEKKNEEKRC